jgi:dipeptide/tripeptide permease
VEIALTEVVAVVAAATITIVIIVVKEIIKMCGIIKKKIFLIFPIFFFPIVYYIDI